MITDKVAIIAQTKKWLSSVVIAHNLCPFAKREFDLDRIHYEVIESEDVQDKLEQLILECAALDKTKDIETSLLIFSAALSSFEDYLDLLHMAKVLLKAQGYEGVYQLASFHPNYCFEDVSADDPSNYTNRSPYPILHILRESSVEAAVKTYPNPEKITERNIKLTRELGVEFMKELFVACYK